MSAPEAILRLRAQVTALAIGLVVFKLWLAAVFPVTGDEAYFLAWGERPDWGYYDHPPMVGWWLAALLAIGGELGGELARAAWLVRLPAVLAPVLMALMLWALLRRRDEERALLGAALLLLAPLNVWNPFITTDTPLVLFSAAAAFAWARALDCDSPRTAAGWHVLAGLALGGAFLSKYFSALLALALFAHCLMSPRGRRPWRGLAITFACAAPFGMFNLAWNWQHCWANLMFNLYNRHDSAGASLTTPLLFALTLLYLYAPPALWRLLRDAPLRTWRAAPAGTRALAVIAFLPLGVFALLSPVKTIGLHWLWSFVAPFSALAALLLATAGLRAALKYFALLALLHVVMIAGASLTPLETWRSSRLYDGIVFHFRIATVIDGLRAPTGLAAGVEPVIAADGYSAAATLSWYTGRHVPVFGPGSSHARHDDLVADFAALDGRDFVILRRRPPEQGGAGDDWRAYFESVETSRFEIEGVVFHRVTGRGFRYAAYREGVLRPIRDRWYRIPSYLPQGGCVFCDRHFGEFCPAREHP